MTVVSVSAILLRAYPYGDTSQILRFVTESHGVLGAVAKGVRRAGGRSGGTLSTFSQGLLAIHFRPNRELQTFRDYSPTILRRGLAGHPGRLAAASVLGELVIRHAEGGDNTALFAALSRGLDAVESSAQEDILTTLLLHTWALVGVLGFTPLLDLCALCGKTISPGDIARLDFAAGGLVCPTCQTGASGPRVGPHARAQLSDLVAGGLDGALIRPHAHLRLVSDFITFHISGGTPLRSIRVLSSLIPETDA